MLFGWVKGIVLNITYFATKVTVRCNPFTLLYLWSIGMDLVRGEVSYKETILQRIYRKMTIKWSFSYNSFVKFHG